MLTCLLPVLIGFTYPLNKDDKAALKTTTKNCAKYYPEAPCLKKLVKKEELVYHAICGEKVNK